MRKVLQRKLRYASVVFAVAVAVALMPLIAQAVLVDFEGFAIEGTAVGTVGIATFSVGTTPPAVPALSPGFIAGVGAPQTAFVPNDTPNPVTNAGTRFLTDETAATGLGLALNYFIDFSAPVTSLSLDLYDYRDDAGPGPVAGATATLTVFADPARTIIVGTDTFIVGADPDGNVETLSVLAPSIRAASLIFSTGDGGTGIDNINFTTTPIPEPSTLLLLGVGLAGARFVSPGRRRRKEMQ